MYRLYCTGANKDIFLVMFSVYFYIKDTLLFLVKSLSISKYLASPACLCPVFDIIPCIPLPGDEPDEKKTEWFQQPPFSFALSLSPKLALIRFCAGLRIEVLCVTAMSSVEIWSSKTITVLERVVIVFRKQDSMGNRNSAYDLRHFPLYSFTAFIAHLHRSINWADDYYITKDITAQFHCSRY